MSIIVDGYNYIGRSQELQLNDPAARDTTIYLMGQYCAKARKTLTLIFDGNYFVHHVNRKMRYGRVTVMYTSPIYTADDAIKKMISHQEPRRRKSMLVVSSDEEILAYARSHGAPISKSEDFEQLVYDTLAAPKQIDRVHIQISEAEVQEWLRLFGHEPAETNASSPAPSGAGKHATAHIQGQTENRHEKKTPQRKKASRRFSSRDPHEQIDRENIRLSSQEVEKWMNIFGAESDDED